MLTLVFIILMGGVLFAQPANNLWQNALEIPLGPDNFAVGSFQGTAIPLAGATSQAGEYIQNATYAKSIWYKFTIPSHRSVRVRVLEPVEALNNNDVGFLVYNSTTAIPTMADLAVFTPFFQLASYSENICLDPGTYYVQVVAKSGANTEVFPDILVEYTHPVSTTFAMDMLNNMHDLGILAHGNNHGLNWSCLSIESPAEYSNVLGSDSIDYTKSAWYKFTTDDHIDLLSYRTYASPNGGTYAIRFYEGDVDLGAIDTLPAVFETTQLFSWDTHNVPCFFKPNTTYSVQILGHKDYNMNSNFTLYHIGEGLVTGAYPQEAAFNPANQFGIINPTPGDGTTVERFDYMSCEALLSNDSIQCGTVNPPDTVVYGAVEYDLTHWYTFTSSAESNATLRVRQRTTQFCNSDYYNHGMRIRVFYQNTDNNCGSYDYPGDLYYDGQLNNNGLVILNCLPTGDYAVQLLGRSTPSNYYGCNSSQMGRRITLNITLSAVPEVLFGLTEEDDADFVNTGNPLLTGVTYIADSARFSCSKTVMPDTAICDVVDRAIYRQIIIGDSDGDGVADSGHVVVQDYAYINPLLNQRVRSVFYKGDANALATAQNAFLWNDTLTGLDPYEGCNMYNAFLYTTNTPHNIKKYCVTPGTYTLASVGDSTDNGALSLPNFTFTKSMQSLFADMAAPENLGDIIGQGLSVTSQTDYFTCLDNPDTIGGLEPCNGYTKQLYREFYLSESCRITVNEHGTNHSPTNLMRLYQGRLSTDGSDNVSLAPFHTNGCYSGSSWSNFSLPACTTVPAGWYTVVSYGHGPNYDNNNEFREEHVYSQSWPYSGTNMHSIHRPSYITVVADTSELPGPFFNRPHKACEAADTISYVNLASDDFPTGSTSYTLCTERFKTVTDTPFVDLPLVGCADAYRVSYYVFTTDDEYYLRITGIQSFLKELYPLDARIDSLDFPSTEPLLTCEGSSNDIEACRLEAGTYTLVVYGRANQNCNVTFTPTVTVAPINYSRFDHAINSYDFGLVPADNSFHGGKIGDVHPTNPALLPSDDTFYCTTGAAATDPPVGCYNSIYEIIYPDTLNNIYHNETGTQPNGKTRNLWYTFVVQGMGTGTVRIRNHTGTALPYFRVFRSDVDGFLEFDDVISAGEVDSTLAMGLESVSQNWWTCSNGPEASFTWLHDVCVEDTIKRRYYVLATLGEQYNKPNVQMDLQVRWNPFIANPSDPKYDFFHQANVLGNGETEPPYTEIPLEYNQLYTGGWGDMSCATGDTTDQAIFGSCAASDQKSLWWKFTIEQTGFLYMGLESNATNYWNFTRSLLQEIEEGDSIVSPGGVNGLLNLGSGAGGGPGGTVPNYNWQRYCLGPGTYYYNIARCATIDTSEVRVHAYFAERQGDYCSNAIGTTGDTFGAYPVSVPVLCHTIGNDFGEDGSNMQCLQGPEGYKSTWFKFSYTGPDLVDILFQLNLSSLSNYIGPANVRYRLFYGDDCSTMIEGQECSTNAFINNSIACISASEGDFYVQVVYPEQSSGTLGYTFTVSENTDPDCNPFNPTLISSDFVYQMNCTGDSLIFTNYASSGSSLDYLWDMGWNNFTTTETNPVFVYPTPGTYDVSLSVINPSLGDTATKTISVLFEPGSSPLDLGFDRTICQGETTSLGEFIPLAVYNWSNGAQTESIEVGAADTYWLELSLNGCLYTDTVNVEVIDLAFDLGSDTQICIGDTFDLGHQSMAGVTYLWSTGATSDSIAVVNEGSYWLELSTGNCVVADTISIDVLDLSFDLGSDTTICAGTSFTLSPDVTPGVAFAWSNGITAPQIEIDAAASYSLEISMDGCTTIDSLQVSVLDLELNMGPDTILCLGDTAWLVPQTNVEVNYLWANGSTAPTLPVFENGWVSLQVDSAACFASDSVQVSVMDLSFEMPADTTICAGATLLIDPLTPTGVSYAWNTAATTPTITVSNAGPYSLQIDSLHCSSTAEMNVEVLDLAFSLGNDTTICDGASLLLNPAVISGVQYLWSDSTTGPSLVVDTAGTYALTIDSMGCVADASIQVDIFYVNPSLASEVTTCLNDTVALTVTGADSLAWNNGGGNITATSALQFLIHPQNSATYNWTAFEDGCAQSGQLSVEIIQPYIPSPVYDNQYCLNESEVVFPDIPFTSGQYIFEGNAVSEIDIATVGSGSYNLSYQYTDTNTCAWSIELPFSIVDTTTISWTGPFPEICINAAPMGLQSYASHNGGVFSVQYQSSGDTLMGITSFDPSLVPGITNLPSDFNVGMTYVNGDNCSSIIAQTLTVHPLPVANFTVADVCIYDTTTFANLSTVVGSAVQGFEWQIPTFGTLSDEVPQDIAFQSSGDFAISLTATSAIGCSQTFVDTVTIHALPEIVFEPYGPACLNDGAVALPVATPAGGSFSLDESEVTNIDSYTYGSGTFNLSYAFTDALGCSNAAQIALVINDTTTTALSLPETVCIDSAPLNLANYASHNPGSFSFAYAENGTDTSAAFFNPALLTDFDNQPLEVSITYSHQNQNGCSSITSDSWTIHPLPNVDFAAANTCLNDTVPLSNNTAVNGSSIEAYLWQLQGWGSSTETAPTDVAYANSGVYDAWLSATSAIGCSQTQNLSFEIYALPNLQVENYGPFCHNDGTIPMPVVAPAGGNYLQEGQDISTLNTYALGAGNSEVWYQYTDSNTCFNEVLIPFAVSDTTTIAFGPDLPDLCINAAPLNLTAHVNHAGGDFHYSYDLADVDTLTGNVFDPAAILGDWEAVNTHWLTYTYTNADNCTSHIADELEIHPLPVINFAVNDACIYEELELSNNSTVVGSGVAAYAWQFQENNPYTNQLPTGVIYNVPGSYEATLALTSDIGCMAIDVAYFEVFALPALSHEPYGPYCQNAAEVPFPEVSPTGGDFFQNNEMIDVVNTYNFTGGVNAIKYAYTDSNTCYNEMEILFVITDTTTISFNAPFPPMCIDAEAIALESYLSHEGGATSAAYGPGTWTDTEAVQPSLVENFAGAPINIPVKFEYTNDNNCSSVVMQPLTVHPLPVFQFSVPDICQNEALQFTNSTYVNGSALESFNWTITGLDTFHSFQLPTLWFDAAAELNYTASTTSTIGCSRHTQGSFTVHPVPQSSFTFSGNCDNVPVVFSATSTIESGTMDNYIWWMDGAAYPADENFEFLFSQWGSHTAGLSSISEFGCRDTVEQTLMIDPSPFGEITAENHCFNTTTWISSEMGIEAGSIDHVVWTSGQELVLVDEPQFEHTYASPGDKNIILQMTSNRGCVTVVNDMILVHHLPQVRFLQSDTGVCQGDTIAFHNVSTVPYPQSIDMVMWDFSNEATFTDSSAIVAANAVGTFDLSLLVMTDSGCVATLDTSGVFQVWPNPRAQFAINPFRPSISHPEIQIRDQSQGNVVAWQYDMGDQTLYDISEPLHLYAEADTFNIIQTVTNIWGCTDRASQLVPIGGFLVFIPNAFTPTGDGINELFKPSIYGEDISSYSFRIWDRWGTEVFYTTDPEKGWDGSHQGSDYYSATQAYVYHVIVGGRSTEVEEFTGMVTLIR